MMNVGDSAQIKGCSTKTRYLETSTGSSSVDSILGTGLPNTSIYIVDEVKSRVYAPTLAKYFLSEGVHNDHDILLAGPAAQCTDLLNNLPTKCETSTSSSTPSTPSSSTSGPNSSMKIAWRYEAVGKVDSSIGGKCSYDLQKPLQSLTSFGSNIIQLPATKEVELTYSDTLKAIKELLKSEKYQKTRAPGKNLLRIVLVCVGSPFWTDPENFSSFLAELQLIIRNSYCVALITTNSSSLPEDKVRELEVTSDLYFRLQAITDDERKTMPGMDKLHGYFQIIRLPTLISPAFPRPPAIDLGFELHRKSFSVKVIHLPPALGAEPTPSTGCKIDF
ncbi:unnamed protein product [Auanema sp. JU1783]|nr:unnamed protein product [Auanema sp. JU1783]